MQDGRHRPSCLNRCGYGVTARANESRTCGSVLIADWRGQLPRHGSRVSAHLVVGLNCAFEPVPFSTRSNCLSTRSKSAAVAFLGNMYCVGRAAMPGFNTCMRSRNPFLTHPGGGPLRIEPAVFFPRLPATVDLNHLPGGFVLDHKGFLQLRRQVEPETALLVEPLQVSPIPWFEGSNSVAGKHGSLERYLPISHRSGGYWRSLGR
jgi:hypothetical protein